MRSPPEKINVIGSFPEKNILAVDPLSGGGFRTNTQLCGGSGWSLGGVILCHGSKRRWHERVKQTSCAQWHHAALPESRNCHSSAVVRGCWSRLIWERHERSWDQGESANERQAMRWSRGMRRPKERDSASDLVCNREAFASLQIEKHCGCCQSTS